MAQERIMAGETGPGIETASSGPQTGPSQGTSPLSGNYDQGTRLGVSAEAEALRSITSQVPEAIRDIRNQAIGNPPDQPPEEDIFGEDFEPPEIPTPRGPRPPEMGDKEWATSAERRRGIIQEIYKLESMDSYRERYAIKTGWMSTTSPEIYNEKNGSYLDQLYLDLQDYARKEKRTRKGGGPEWDPGSVFKLDFAIENIGSLEQVRQKRKEEMEKRFGVQNLATAEINKLIEKFQKAEQKAGEEETPAAAGEGFFAAEKLIKRPDGEIYSINELQAIIDDSDKSAKERADAEEGLLIYFRQAKNAGLLKEVDANLTSLHRDIAISQIRESASGRMVTATTDELEALVERGITRARTRGAREFKEKRAGHSELAQYTGIEKVYIDWAERRFEKLLERQTQEQYRIGEHVLGSGEQPRRANPKETYWRTGSWPEYYTVTARTPEEFRKATQTFLRMIKTRALGLSPEKLLPHFENFAKALGQAGSAPDVSAGVTSQFMEELRQEFEGLSYIYGAWYCNETYNPEKYVQFMMALAFHEGPQRMIALARSGDGQVGAFLKILDDDPRTRAYYNSGGSRGQIGNDTVTQNIYQQEYMNILIEEGMGIRMKDYDPFDSLLNGNTPQVVEARRARMLELGRIERELKLIEEEVRTGRERRKLSDDEMKIYNAFVNTRTLIGIHMSDERFRGLYEGFEFDKEKACNAANANIRNWEEFKDIEEDPALLPERLRHSIELGGVQVKLQKIRAEVAKGTIKLKPGEKALDLLAPYEQGIYQAAYEQAKANLDIALQIEGAFGEKVLKAGGVYFIDRNPYVKAYEKDWQNLEWKDKEKKIQRPFSELSREQKIGRILSHIRDGAEVFSQEEINFYKGLSAEEKTDHVDSMPTDQANGFVHCAENKIKIVYANVSAKERKRAQAEWRVYAEKQLEQNGFDAILRLPKPKFDTDPQSPTYGDVIGVDGIETITFKEALDSPLAGHTHHTYAAYQQEHRHALTEPDVLKAAKLIRMALSMSEEERKRAGLPQPEDVDILAGQALLLDPILKRIKRLPANRQNREVMILDALVDESDQGHWRIDREVSKMFLTDDGDGNKIRMGYNREDFGGTSRFIIAVKAYIAAHPKRFSRRFAALISEIPMHVTSYSDKLGVKGALKSIEMHADPIGQLADQRLASQFSLTKYINEMRYGWLMFGALFGYVDEEKGVSVEGLYEKPTNNSDKLSQCFDDLQEAGRRVEKEDKLFYEIMETFGRLDRVLKLMRVMESDTNNAQGALDLTESDVFLKDGRFNREIAVEGNRDTGASRHSQREFFNAFVDWLQDKGPGGGAQAYPSETAFYQHLNEQYWYIEEIDGQRVRQTPKNADGTPRTWRNWLFDKMCR